MSENPRVPFWLRGAISEFCKIAPFGVCGRAGYRLIASHCARRLPSSAGTQAVFLRGKDPAASNPGISDLDFWLFCPESELGTERVLQEIRARYRRLRTYCVLPGKLEVTSHATWERFRGVAPAAFLEDLPLRRLTACGWEPESICPAQPVRPLSRFNLGMYNFFQALSYFPEAVRGKSRHYHFAVFAKFLNKAMACAQHQPSGRDGPQDKAELLAETFLALHRVAMDGLGEETMNVPVEASVRSVAADQYHATAGSEPDRLNNLLQQQGFSVKRASPPRLLLWDLPEPERDTTERLFAVLVEYLTTMADNRTTAVPRKPPDAIVTLPMYQCLWRGSRLGPMLENLASIPSECAPRHGCEGSFKTAVFLYFVDRLVTRANHGLGVIVSYPATTFAKPLLYFCMELLVVHTRHITNDLELLCELSRAQLPFTVNWLQRMHALKFPSSYAGWIEAFVQVRSESLPLLADLADCGYGRL